VNLTRTRFTTTGGAAERGTVLRFRLRRPGTVVLVVRRADCSLAGQKRVHGSSGVNRVRFNGRFHGRPLAPGSYTIDLVVVRGPTTTRFAAIAVEVVPPGSRLTKAQQTDPLANDCEVASNAPSLPVFLTSTAGPIVAAPATRTTSAAAKEPDTTKAKRRTGVLGVSVQPPRLRVPGVGGGGRLWVGILLLVLFGVGLATLATYVVRFMRGSWYP
jgi:hypothetical protein